MQGMRPACAAGEHGADWAALTATPLRRILLSNPAIYLSMLRYATAAAPWAVTIHLTGLKLTPAGPSWHVCNARPAASPGGGSHWPFLCAGTHLSSSQGRWQPPGGTPLAFLWPLHHHKHALRSRPQQGQSRGSATCLIRRPRRSSARRSRPRTAPTRGLLLWSSRRPLRPR